MKRLAKRILGISITLAYLATANGLSMPTTQNQPSNMPRTSAFLNRSRKRSSERQTAPALSRTRLEVLHKRHHHNDFLSAAPLVAATSAMVVLPLLAGAAAQALLHGSPQDPAVEAEVLTDLAHMTLDVATLFGPSKLGIRMSTIIGRLCVMAADYVPDHIIVPEEMVFQTAMLCLASIGLCKSALPLLLAAGSSVSLRQGKVYRNLFQPTGMSWHQFKAMDVLCMDWVSVDAGEILDATKHVYWLYSGNVVVSEEEQRHYNVTAVAGKSSAEAVFGEVQLITKKKSSSESPEPVPSTKIQAGFQGATLLRIDVPKLRVLLKADKELEDCMRTLAFQSLQSKLTAQYTAA